jgi:hypothetical protein
MIALCLETKNTRNIHVKISFVPYPANYASACVVGTIYMAWHMTKVTYAGVYAVSLFCMLFIRASQARALL